MSIAASLSHSSRQNILTAAILVVVNVVMLVFMWPGFFQADHQTTIMGIIAGWPSEWHSLLWGYLALPFLYWTPSYGFYGFLQIALFAVAATFSISRLASLRVIGRGGVGRIALTCAYAVTPTFLFYNMLWASDVVFAIVLIPLTTLFIEIVVSKGECFKRASFAVGFALLLFFAIELRKNASLIFVCAIPLLLLRYGPVRKTILAIAACILAGMVGLSLFFSVICGAEKSPSQEMLSVPAQQIARTMCDNGEIPDSAADTLYSTRSRDEWIALYKPYSADQEKAGLALTPEFVYAWFITGLENSKSYFRAYVDLLGAFYAPFEQDVDLVERWWLSVDMENHDRFSSAYFSASVSKGYQNQFTGAQNNANDKGLSLVDFLNSESALATLLELLFFNRALPLWGLMAGAVIVFLRRGRLGDYFMVALPALCVLASLLLFSPVALFRYSMEIYYCFPVIAAWVVRLSRTSRYCLSEPTAVLPRTVTSGLL